MTQEMRLSNREWEVIHFLLQGKSNKLIALSLGISVRTVEFHLKNIYAKYQVSSRIELILKLANMAGNVDLAKLGSSTVADQGQTTDNRGSLIQRKRWGASLRGVLSIIGKELDLKAFWKSKQLWAGVITALVTGSIWIALLDHFGKLLLESIAPWLAPIAAMFIIIGVAVAYTGRRNGSTPFKVGLSAWLGTGLAPIMIIPAMLGIVLPIGKLFERFGWINREAMPLDVATTLAIVSMMLIWLVAGAGIGILVTYLTVKKPPVLDVQHMTEQRM